MNFESREYKDFFPILRILSSVKNLFSQTTIGKQNKVFPSLDLGNCLIIIFHFRTSLVHNFQHKILFENYIKST